jgi:hypothetical protein
VATKPAEGSTMERAAEAAAVATTIVTARGSASKREADAVARLSLYGLQIAVTD